MFKKLLIELSRAHFLPVEEYIVAFLLEKLI